MVNLLLRRKGTMSTKISQVNTVDLIKSIYDAEKKLRKASTQLTLLQNSIHENKVRYEKAKKVGNQAHSYNIYLKISTLEGVSAMYHHYTEVKVRQLEWLHYYFMKRTGMSWSDYQLEKEASKHPQTIEECEPQTENMDTDDQEDNESDMSYDSDAGTEIFL